MELTHASFFSGAGGTDIGLENAGWRTVSFSEVEPYACALLKEQWPGIPNLGDIVRLSEHWNSNGDGGNGDFTEQIGVVDNWKEATLWSGGFPCQDLSIAGKRAGFEDGTRSVLAFSFLDLVERFRPQWIILENVPGLLSSNEGRDFGRLLGTLGKLGYGWAYRILDARYFGVAQRRRRVFIVASFGNDRAREVLFESEGSGGNFTPSNKKGEKSTDRFADGVGAAGILPQAINAKWVKRTSGPAGDEHHNLIVGETIDSGGVRKTNGLAGRSHHSQDLELIEAKEAYHQRDRVYGEVAPPLDAYGDTPSDGPIVAYRKSARVNAAPDSPETWVDDGIANTLNNFDIGDIRTTHAVIGAPPEDDPLLPKGIDSHRYRVIGNGVAAPVVEWIGRRIIEVEKNYLGSRSSQT